MHDGVEVAGGNFPSDLLYSRKGGECYVKKHEDLMTRVTKLLWALAALTAALAELVRVIKM